MKKQPWPIVRCEVCTRPFSQRPYRKDGDMHFPKHCSWDCAQVTVRRNAKGKPITAACAARSLKMAARYGAMLRALFGDLTDREVELMRRAERRGYARGYQAAYTGKKRAA